VVIYNLQRNQSLISLSDVIKCLLIQEFLYSKSCYWNIPQFQR